MDRKNYYNQKNRTTSFFLTANQSTLISSLLISLENRRKKTFILTLTSSSNVGHDLYRLLLVASSHHGTVGFKIGASPHPIRGSSSGTEANSEGGRGGFRGGPTLGLRIVANPSYTVEHGIIYT